MRVGGREALLADSIVVDSLTFVRNPPVEGETIVGYALCRWDRAGEPDSSTVRYLAVRRPWRKRGIALALLLIGLAFKMAAVPFHFWSPDVYDGAPTPVTAFFSVIPWFPCRTVRRACARPRPLPPPTIHPEEEADSAAEAGAGIEPTAFWVSSSMKA